MSTYTPTAKPGQLLDFRKLNDSRRHKGRFASLVKIRKIRTGFNGEGLVYDVIKCTKTG